MNRPIRDRAVALDLAEIGEKVCENHLALADEFADARKQLFVRQSLEIHRSILSSRISRPRFGRQGTPEHVEASRDLPGANGPPSAHTERRRDIASAPAMRERLRVLEVSREIDIVEHERLTSPEARPPWPRTTTLPSFLALESYVDSHDH
jgi:hypothetical protein